MEGTVVDLGDGTVAKVWSGRNMADLLRLREFHDAVHARRPSTATVAMPRILDLRDVDGTPVTIELHLAGEPLWRADGTPFFWLGDTAWELFHRLDYDEALALLDARYAALTERRIERPA